MLSFSPSSLLTHAGLRLCIPGFVNPFFYTNRDLPLPDAEDSAFLHNQTVDACLASPLALTDPFRTALLDTGRGASARDGAVVAAMGRALWLSR